MNGLDVLNATPTAPGQAGAVRPGEAPPDDAGGHKPRAFTALLDAIADPAVAEGTGQPAPVTFVAPPSAVLRQALQVPAETAPADGATGEGAVVDVAAQAADAAGDESDDMALHDLVADPEAPTGKQDAQTAQLIWLGAVSGAAGLIMPGPVGPGPARDPAPPRQASVPVARTDQQQVGNGVINGLSADVGRLFDAAAGAAEAVLSNAAGDQLDTDVVLNAKVTVLRTETHLPPVTLATPLHQVVSAITTNILAGSPAAPAPGAPDPSISGAPDRQLVRTLDIRLEPPDLGSVTVKLRLTGQHLALRITAETAATAQSLDQDRDTLATLLRGNGYTTEISAVRHEPGAAAVLSHSAPDASASSQSAANQAGGQGQGDGGARSQNGQPGSQQQSGRGTAAPFEPGEHHDAEAQDTASRRALYL